MPSHAELAGKLLYDAASFYRTLGEQNEPLRKQMTENAVVFEQMAILIAEKPTGAINNKSHGEMAGRLLKDSALFFRTLAEQNELLRDHMIENANIYDQIGDLVIENPVGILD
jgi:hypothetical protein